MVISNNEVTRQCETTELSEISIKNRSFYRSINKIYESIKKLCWHLVIKNENSIFIHF